MKANNNLETGWNSLTRVLYILIALVMVFPVLSVVGWLTNNILLSSLDTDYIPMAPSTAISFIILCLSLFLLSRPSFRLRQSILTGIAGGFVALYGLLTFIGLTTGLPIAPDNMIFPDLGLLNSIPIGRMSPATGALFFLSGTAVLSIRMGFFRTKRSGFWQYWSFLSGVSILFLSLIFTAGYSLSSPLFYEGNTIPIALTTSVAFIFSGGAVLVFTGMQSNTSNQLFNNIQDINVGAKLKFGFVTVLFLVTLLGTISYMQTKKIHLQAQNMYDHPLKVRRSIGELTADIYAIRVDMKNLFLSDEEPEKAANLISLEVLDESTHRTIDTLRISYLGPASDIDSLEYAYLNWRSIREETIRLFREGKMREAADRSTFSGDGGEQAETVLRALDKISQFATGKGDALYASSEEITKSLSRQLLFLLALIVLISFFISNVLLRAVRNPIDELTRATRRFHEGDFEARSSNTTKNEFGVLAASFNKLVENIQFKNDLDEKYATLTSLMLNEYDITRFFQTTLEALAMNTGSQMAAAYLLSEDKKTFDYFESLGINGTARQSFAADQFDGEFGMVLNTHKIHHLKDIPEDTRFVFHTVHGKFIPREIITLPVISNKEVVAIISLSSVHAYSMQSVQLIDRILVTLCARVEGILAYHKMKELSKKLTSQNHELETQKTELASQSAELSEQNTELEMQKAQVNEASRLKTDFLSNMSHELRTPLNSVIALSGVLNRRLSGKISDEEYSYIAVIERNGKQLLTLINDILDISRIESGHEEIEISKFNTNNLISEMVSMIRPQAEEKNIQLLNAEGDSEQYITSDINKCRHILQNLIGNAIKFTEKGKVEITSQLSEENILITVSDTGIGISENHLPHIFDEFRQADGSTSRRFGGTGLGLAIAKKYAILIGGNIAVKSTIGKGSEFTLSLPLNNSAENPITGVQTASGSSVKTILVVDDSEPTIIQIKNFLEESGYHILAAKDGGEALAIIAQTIPDAIILDLMMPGIDGYEVLKTLREAKPTAHVPVLILTAKHITREELKFLKRNNIHQLIQKGDVNRNELKNAVASMAYPQSAESVKPQIKGQTTEGKPLVLVVEDNPDNMITAKAILADNFTVIEATDGKTGIKLARQFHPNLILMDIGLPGMDGIMAFKAIRNSVQSQLIPVIALTASAMLADREAILAHGFDAYIAKPIDETEFFKVINETLYGK